MSVVGRTHEGSIHPLLLVGPRVVPIARSSSGTMCIMGPSPAPAGCALPVLSIGGERGGAHSSHITSRVAHRAGQHPHSQPDPHACG